MILNNTMIVRNERINTMEEKLQKVAEDYEHMIDFVSDDNINKGSLDTFLGEEREYKPEVRKQVRDPEFSEPWQNILVSFANLQDYTEFMNKMDSKPAPKLKSIIYERPGTRTDIFNFVEGDQ